MLLEGIFNSKQKKVSNYRVVVLSINNETRYVPFLFFFIGIYDIRSVLSSRQIVSWENTIKLI